MEALIGGALGFLSFTLTSHPSSPLAGVLPKKKFRRFHVAPELKFELRNRVIHLHHWMLFIGVYALILTIDKGFLQADLVQGFVVGSIAQGLTYEDRFMFVYSARHRKIRGKKLLVPSKNP